MSEAIGTVTEVWRYPAKSMLGERIPEAAIGLNGVAGDRGWAVRDEEAGAIRGAKKIPELMQWSARYLVEPTADDPTPAIEIGLPDGSTVTSDDPSVAAALSSAAGRALTLWPRQPATDTEHHLRKNDHEDLYEELKAIFGREGDEPLPDLSDVEPELLAEILTYESPLGTYFDMYPLLVVTRQSLDRLAELAPDSAIDVRRFRPNIVVDCPDLDAPDGFPELAWAGGQARIGEISLQMKTPCSRCVMVTHPVAELEQDRQLLRTIVADADQKLGVYAQPTSIGVVRPGDEVVLVG